MNKKISVTLALLVAVSVALIAQQASSKKPDTTVDSPLTESMRKMHASMAATPLSGNEDVDFARLMIPHHQAAIDMAKAELLKGKDPQLRRLAQQIITDQQSEIELMNLWLTKHPSSSRKEK